MPPIPVIIDTDPGVDDVIALLLALSSPHLVVVGITLTHGNCTLSSTEKNLSKLFYSLERHLEFTKGRKEQQERWRGVTDRAWRRKWGGEGAETIKVWKGCEGPLQGKAVTAKYFHGQDGLANCETLHPELTPPADYTSPFLDLRPESALEGVTSLVRSGAMKLSYIALGPMTSLAQLSERMDLEHSFDQIYSMGGAVVHPGNTTPVAEFNYYADPWSARTIFNLSLANFHIFPLDLTSYLTLPFSLYASSIDPTFSTYSTSEPSSHPPEGSDPLIHFTSCFLKGTEEVMKSFGGDAMELHDPTVIFALIEYARDRDESSHTNSGKEEEKEGELAKGWNWKRVDFEIECDGTLTRGMLVLDHRASSKTSTSITSRTGQTNRAIAIEQDEDSTSHTVVDIAEVEARRAEKKRKCEEKKISGARVVVTSPGSDLMRREMLERVWGVEG